ncbi:hypothetical protein SUGI_0467800 [Cryptomeria japonica]|uniref:uncharacterized protein LOC131076594 n=1 Tax=Cryptomeria japonica TaxID=3369 RepID=UPI002408A208|nr:uncharacterized protein LOC131076594 [Cryptomeria japonica]GLJ24495.1 hypothetical protein SUGI_0467800 [Cryptomeria japonica]
MASMRAYHCASRRHCLWWVEKLLRECVCGMRDYVSVVLGLISLFSWGIAEVPQILTNLKNGSTEGVSLGFLMTWVVGDLFNLIGCWLEPATLPTQFYTALLYTITTIVLVCQIIYYDHIYKWWKLKKAKCQLKIQPEQISECDQNGHIKAEHVKIPESTYHSFATVMKNSADSNIISLNPVSSLPIPNVSPRQRPISGSDLYFMSARSLASSHTPTSGSYLVHHSGRSYTFDESSLEEEGLLTNLISPSPKKSNTILRSIASTIFFLGGLNYFNLPIYNNIISPFYSSQAPRTSAFIIPGRKLLQGRGGGAFGLVVREESSRQLGTWLGWLMAAIYMGGRLPQICLNIKRGTVEGLNPLMFIFALFGNATYVGSILVRTLDWEKLKPNMPWLIDAAVCVLLDFFILVQFIYYKVRRTDAGGVEK